MPWNLLASPAAVAEAALRTALGYAAVVAILRVQGNRTLSQLRAFDLVMTVALGSLLGAMAVGAGVTVLAGATAVATIVGLQTLVAWLSARSDVVHRLVTTRPRLLAYDGRTLADELRAARLREEDVWMAARRQGVGSRRDVKAVVLEANGDFTVLRGGADDGAPETLPAQRADA